MDPLSQTVIQNGFWFIDIPRTGSTSIKEELATLYGPSYGKSDPQFGSSGTLPWPDHLSATQVIDRIGEESWNQLFTFSLVRNPWDRAYSLFQYRRRYIMNIPLEMSFSEYLQKLATERRLPVDKRTWYPGYVMSACDFLTDSNGRILVKYVGKYEDRDQVLATINQHLPTPLRGTLFRMASTAGSAPFQSFYSPEDRDLVAELFSDDIERFGYSFEDSMPAVSSADKTSEKPLEDWLNYARRLAEKNTELLAQLTISDQRNKDLSRRIEYLSRRRTWIKHLVMFWKHP